jgi:predicted small lipoprotein YifL
MHAKAPKRIARKLTVLISAMLLAACGQGDGPISIPNEPATPLPPLPPGFCDPINFEIFCETPAISNFNGGKTIVIDNPDKGGLNETDKVAQMEKFPDDPALLFGGTKLELSGAIDFSKGESFSMLVWSPRSVRVTYKLEEQGNPGGGREIELTHTGSGGWEELCYDFTGQTGGIPTPVTAVTIIFDNGVRGAADTDPENWTFFYDEITQVADCGGGPAPGPLDLPQDFENAVDSQFNNFNGGQVTIIDNPDVSGINLSARVAQMQKFEEEVFGGSTMPLANVIDFGNGEVFKVKVWSPRNVPMLFKLEGLDQELSLNHTGSGTWEELCYDFTGMTAGPAATAITFIFDLGEMGDAANDPGNWTFYFDDIVQVADCDGGGGPPVGGTPITPDNVVYATDPNLVVDLPPPVVGNFGSGAVFDFAFAGDPDYNPALQITSGEGYGAGVHVGFVALTGYAPGFAAGFENVVFKVKGDAANLTSFEVKFIEGGVDTSVLYDLTTYGGSEDIGNGWYQVSIPMTDFAATIADNAGFLLGPAGDQGAAFTLLLTDIGFTGTVGGGGGAGLVVNGDFEAGNLDDWEVFDNGGTIALTAPGEGNPGTAVNLNIVVPGNPTLKQTGIGAGTLAPNQAFAITFDWKGSAANGGVIDFQVFSEQAGGGVTKADLVQGGDAFPADWTTVGPLNFTTGPDVAGGLTVQITAICGGAAGCVSDLFIDNVVVETP